MGGQDQVYLEILCSGGVAAARGGEDGGSSALPEVCGWGDPLNGILAGAVPPAGAAQGHYNGTAHLWRGAGCI